MSQENRNGLEYTPPDHKALTDIVNICDARIEETEDNHVAYLRTPHTTVMIHDCRSKQANNEVTGRQEVWVLDWLNQEQPGYGPHTFTTYKFFMEPSGIRVKRLFEVNGSNGDRREESLQSEAVTLPEYLTDADPEFALIKQAFEGIPRSAELLGSTEQQMEAINRFFGGDPEETQLGLHDMTQEETEKLRKLLHDAEPTDDPYFEQ